jgi:hypothetical protein
MTDATEKRWRDRTIARLQKRWNIEPPTDEERSAARRSVHERYLRGLRRRRVWRRRVRSIDPGKPPLTLLRWLAVLGLGIAWWTSGAKTSPPHNWIPYAVIAGALILPDIAGFAIGGFRLDLQQAQDAIAQLRQDVNAQARASAKASVGPIFIGREERIGLETFGRVVQAEREEQVAYVPGRLDSDGGAEVP